MNILYNHRTQATGTEGVHISYIIKGFRDMGHSVFIVSPTDKEPLQTAGDNPFAEKEGSKARFFDVLSRMLPHFLFELREVAYNFSISKKLKTALEERKIDFIYERYAFFMSAGVKMSIRKDIPIIVEVNEIVRHRRIKKQAFIWWAQARERFIFRNASAIVVVSEFLKEELRSTGIDGEKIFVIPNAVDADKFFPHKVKGAIQHKYHMTKDIVVIGFIGWFVPWHNIELLINIFGRITRYKKVLLFLVGDGALKEEFLMMVKAKGITEHVIFPGAVPYDHIPDYISLMDICVIPESNRYRSPLKMFEYMAMEKAVVAPGLGPIERIIEDGVNGMLFESGDQRSLENILVDLIEDENKRQLLGSNARKKIVEQHTWHKNAERIVKIVDELES